MKLTGLAIIAASLAAATTAGAEDIQWAQVTNLPKGLNLPKDVTVDVLGIELGEAYASAKAKLERLHRDSPAKADDKKIEQSDRRISMVLPGTSLSATYPGYIDFTSKVPGAGRIPIEERLTVFFSAPPSGQQVIGIERTIEYSEHADQPRIAELLDRLKAKFKAEPVVNPRDTSVEYTFVFDNGRAVDPKTLTIVTCNADHGIQRAMPTNSRDVARMNSEGRCDIVLRLTIAYGLSKDHIKRVTFAFSDSERTKANFTTDDTFFGNYVKQLQDKTKGTGPKL
jgi:hypothetical protein